MNFVIYAIENNYGSLITRVRFRVIETIGTMERVKDDCAIELEGRWDFENEELLAQVELAYRQAMGI
jgi:hypothetical protein